VRGRLRTLPGSQSIGAQVVQVDAPLDQWPRHARKVVVEQAHEQVNRVDLVVPQSPRLLLGVLQDQSASNPEIGIGMQRAPERPRIHADRSQRLDHVPRVDEPAEHVCRSGRSLDD